MPRPSRSSPRPAPCTDARGRQRGLTLIELVMFVVIVGAAVAGVLKVYTLAVGGSADPLVRKQATAVAESLLTEVLMQPFTWCDPQDPANDANSPPASAAACTTPQDGGGTLGPAPAGETRGSATNPFDNVADYHGFAMGPGIAGLDGSAPAALAGYSASV